MKRFERKTYDNSSSDMRKWSPEKRRKFNKATKEAWEKYGKTDSKKTQLVILDSETGYLLK